MLGAMTRRRHAPRAVLVLLAAALGGCLTLEPVHERLHLLVLPDGRMEVTASIEIDPLSEPPEEQDAALVRRLERLRSELEGGQDAWSRALTPDRCASLDVSQSWQGGLLSASRRKAVLDLESVPDLFRGTDVDAWLEHGDGWTELRLAPRTPTRATREQRQEVAAALDRFSEALARHVQAMGALHEWLDLHPGRAQACFDALGSGPGSEPEWPDPHEREIVRLAHESLLALADFFFVESGREGMSLDALVRLAHDPHPAEVTFEAPDVLEFEGLDRRDSRLAVPSRSLWTALESMEERWMAPDVAVTAMRALLADEEIELGPLAALPRRRAKPAPTATEIREHLVSALAPQPLSRVRWRTSPEPEPAP